jgi:hypothetical protein
MTALQAASLASDDPPSLAKHRVRASEGSACGEAHSATMIVAVSAIATSTRIFARSKRRPAT